MIDHVTCYGIQVRTHPTRSDSLVNNLHYKKEKKNLKGFHDYVLLPRSLQCLLYGGCLVDRDLIRLF